MYAFKKRIRKAIDFGKNRIVCTVNSFTSDEMKPFDASGGNDYDSGETIQDRHGQLFFTPEWRSDRNGRTAFERGIWIYVSV